MTRLSDLSTGTLPPAENLQYDPPPPERIGWPETIGFAVFIVLWAGVAIIL